MAISNKLRGRISARWLEAEQKAKPNNKHLVMVTKRPKLVDDQRKVAQLFGKTKFRVGMVALLNEEDLLDFAAAAKYCTHAEV